MQLDLQQTVANLVLDHSETAAVFQRHRIDFCCRGGISIAAAAVEKGLTAEALARELSDEIAARQGGARSLDPRELSTPRLVAYIISKHHEYLRQALPFVRGLAAKVSRVHGDHNPKLRELDTAVAKLCDALIAHIDDEEQLLFPTLTAPTTAATTKPFAAAPGLLASMLSEHLAVAALLDAIRTASENFTLPDWACNSYRTLFAELEQVERDTFAHVHIENHVLQPRFMPT
jgi:regulator of cell morphogenesis and NO signaling